MKKIVFTGGGTAGHVIPNLALISYLKNYEIYYIGSFGIEKEILKKYPNIKYFDIPSTKLRRNFSLKNLAIPFKLIQGYYASKKILKQIKPDVVFSKGGYVSLPVILASKSLHIPSLTHESDISMGLANKIISKYVDSVLCTFKTTIKKEDKRYKYTSSPLRPELKYGDKTKILGYKHLDKDKKTILVFGGSLGASNINEFIYSNVDNLTKDYNILHITGKNKSSKDINIKNYVSLEYTDSIENYFDASDYVISRAGSNAIHELLALNKKAILIPLTNASSRGEQYDNAMYFKKQNLVEVLLEEDLSLNNLKKSLQKADKLKPSNIDIDKNNLGIIKEIERFL